MRNMILSLLLLITVLLTGSTYVSPKNNLEYINNPDIHQLTIHNIMGFTGGHHNIMIFKNGKVYVWGYNGDGELGLGDTTNRNTPTENTYLENITNQNGGIYNFFSFYICYSYNLLFFRNSKVYVWGYNEYGDLGINDTNNRLLATENTYLEDIIRINGGLNNIYNLYVNSGHHNILIFKNGKVYVWGYNDYGELGLGDTTNRLTPTENTQLENIISQNGGVNNIHELYISTYHNILIFKNGKFYVWGRNDHGELGLGDTTNRNTPIENTNLENITQQNGGVENIYSLYTGCCYNILIFKNGKVYVWGYNDHGELGLGDTTNRNTPTENTQLENIIQQNRGINNIYNFYNGNYHNILIFKSGEVYVWGGNWLGQLGTGNTNNILSPTQDSNLENIINQNGGVNNIYGLFTGATFNIVIFKNGTTYVWGWNPYGELGLGDTTTRETPTKNPNLENLINQFGLPIINSSDLIEITIVI